MLMMISRFSSEEYISCILPLVFARGSYAIQSVGTCAVGLLTKSNKIHDKNVQLSRATVLFAIWSKLIKMFKISALASLCPPVLDLSLLSHVLRAASAHEFTALLNRGQTSTSPSKPIHRSTGNCWKRLKKHFRNPNCRSEWMFWIGMILRMRFVGRLRGVVVNT